MLGVGPGVWDRIGTARRLSEKAARDGFERTDMNTKKVASELLLLARDLTADASFNTMLGIGRAKYVVNYHDGVKTHPDGSKFFDIAIFSNKKTFDAFVADLKKKGYREE